MSSDNNLQEMEAGTKQSKTAVNAGAKPAEPMQTLDGTSYEDLGGPTPDNYRPDDGSAELKDAGAGLKSQFGGNGLKSRWQVCSSSKSSNQQENQERASEHAEALSLCSRFLRILFLLKT